MVYILLFNDLISRHNILEIRNNERLLYFKMPQSHCFMPLKQLLHALETLNLSFSEMQTKETESFSSILCNRMLGENKSHQRKPASKTPEE